MFDGGLFKIKDLLTLIIQLQLNGALSAKDRFLHLLHASVEVLDLVT